MEKCKICHDEIPPFVSPCDCKGSIKYIHQECLERWVNTSLNEVCPECKQRYSSKKIYNGFLYQGCGEDIETYKTKYLFYYKLPLIVISIMLFFAKLFVYLAHSIGSLLTDPLDIFSVSIFILFKNFVFIILTFKYNLNNHMIISGTISNLFNVSLYLYHCIYFISHPLLFCYMLSSLFHLLLNFFQIYEKKSTKIIYLNKK